MSHCRMSLQSRATKEMARGGVSGYETDDDTNTAEVPDLGYYRAALIMYTYLSPNQQRQPLVFPKARFAGPAVAVSPSLGLSLRGQGI